MKKKIVIMLTLSVVALFGLVGNVNAVPYTFSNAELDGWGELWDDPAGSAMVIYEPNGTIADDGQFAVIFPFASGSIGLGVTPTEPRDFSAYSGFNVGVHNSSTNTPIYASLFAQVAGTKYFSDAMYLTDNADATLALDFTNVFNPANLFAYAATGDLTGSSADITAGAGSVESYGIAVGTTSGYFVHASVPEPSTLFLLGGGLIGLAGFRRLQRS